MTTPVEGAEETLYALLGVDEDADTDTIRKASRKLLQKHHPDRGGDPDLAARINAAANTLLDPERREAYDTSLHAPEEATPTVDPDDFEDDWGEEGTWADDADSLAPEDAWADEEIDDEYVDETPAPTSTEAPTPAAEAPPAPRPEKMPVVTPLGVGAKWGLGVGAVASALVTAATLLWPPAAARYPLIYLAVGALLGILVAVAFGARKASSYPGRRWSPILAVGAAVVALTVGTWAAHRYGDFGIAGQLALPAFAGTFITWSALARQRTYRHLTKPSQLRAPGMTFGSGSGTAASDLVSTLSWSILGANGMAGARSFRSHQPRSAYQQAISNGQKIALIHGIVLPYLPEGYRVYWSAPGVFRVGGDGIPASLATLPQQGPFRRAAQKAGTRTAAIQEFVVIWSPKGDHELTVVPSNEGPALLAAEDAQEVILEFLRSPDGQDEAVVDYEVAMTAGVAAWDPPRV